MRGYVWAIALGGFLPACTDADSSMASANVLELKLGGDDESLSAALRRPPPGAERNGGPVRRPPPKGVPKTVPKTARDEPKLEPRRAAPQLEPPRTRPSKAGPQRASPGFRTVTLAEGETLYGLCRTHLGRGARWKEVAALNGWSESQAGHLPAGQAVKLPLGN